MQDLFSAPTFLGLPAAGFVFGHWFQRSGNLRCATYSTGSAVMMLVVFFGLASAAFNQVAFSCPSEASDKDVAAAAG